jgi:hypothetical protein
VDFILKRHLTKACIKGGVICAAVAWSTVVSIAAELHSRTKSADWVWYGKMPEVLAVFIPVVFDLKLLEYTATFGGGYAGTVGHGDEPMRCLQIEPEAVTEVECKALLPVGTHWGLSMPLKVSLHPGNEWKSR